MDAALGVCKLCAPRRHSRWRIERENRLGTGPWRVVQYAVGARIRTRTVAAQGWQAAVRRPVRYRHRTAAAGKRAAATGLTMAVLRYHGTDHPVLQPVYVRPGGPGSGATG